MNSGGQHARYPIGGDEYTDPQARPASLGATGGGAIGAVAGAWVVGVLTFVFIRSVPVLTVATVVGAYIGTLAGALLITRGGNYTDLPDQPAITTMPHAREAGVLLAVHVNPGEQLHAVRVLREANGEDIEEASGLWKDGRWADFDPTHMVKPASWPASATASTH